MKWICKNFEMDVHQDHTWHAMKVTYKVDMQEFTDGYTLAIPDML